MLYNYLTGGEFNNRISFIKDTYVEMAKQLETEKKQTYKRWSVVEATLEKGVKSLYGMSGDLQGIAGQEIIAIPDMEYDKAGE